MRNILALAIVLALALPAAAGERSRGNPGSGHQGYGGTHDRGGAHIGHDRGGGFGPGVVPFIMDPPGDCQDRYGRWVPCGY
jgi:hypothetical protein